MSTSIKYKGATIASFTNDTKTLTTQGKYLEANVEVTDSTPSPSLQNKTVTPTTSQQTVTADSGYDGLGTVTVNAMPSGSATTPATSITANPSISVSSSGLITATASASKSITPTVSAGYVSSGTAGTVTVSGSNTSQLATQAAQTITPTTTDQTITSGKYLTGTQTIKGDANLVAGNIKKDVSIFGVMGTHEGGGGGLPVVTGSFTAGTAGTVQTINVPYTGNGYPLAIVCVVADGESTAKPYNTTLLRKNHGSCVLVKTNPALTPTFKTGTYNVGTVFSHHRTSSSSQGSDGFYGVAYSSSSNPSGSGSTGSTIKVSAKNQFKIYVSSGDNVYGFYSGQEYDYWVMYSE